MNQSQVHIQKINVYAYIYIYIKKATQVGL